MINIYDTLKTCGNTVVNTVKEVTNNCSLLNAVHACMTPSLIRKKSNRLLFDDSRFYRINLNGRGRTHHSYVNIEEQRTSGKAFVSPLQRLPFDDHTVKIIFVDFGTFQKSREQLAAIFKEWGRIIVPNGVLTMDNCIPDDAVMGLLDECGFKKVFHESHKFLSCKKNVLYRGRWMFSGIVAGR